MYRLRVLRIPAEHVGKIVAEQPRLSRVLALLQNWDGETFAFENHQDARSYRRVLDGILRDASSQQGSPLPPPDWDPEWDTFEIVVEVYKPDGGWRVLPDELPEGNRH
jgi:hypothetical protein